MGKVKQSSTPKLQSFTEMLPAFPVMPDENPLDYEAFEIGLLADLAPQTAYEHIVAQNIIANEWELMRLRRWMAAIITVHAEQQLSANISEQLDSDTLENTDADCLAKAVMQGDPQREAHKCRQQYGIDPTRSLSLAYSMQGDVVHILNIKSWPWRRAANDCVTTTATLRKSGGTLHTTRILPDGHCSTNCANARRHGLTASTDNSEVIFAVLPSSSSRPNSFARTCCREYIQRSLA